MIVEESQEDRIGYIRTSALLASDTESARTYYHYTSNDSYNVDGLNLYILIAEPEGYVKPKSK